MPTQMKTIRCECGYEARSTHVEELITALRRHGVNTHQIEFTREQALLIICRQTQSPELEGDRR